MMSSSRAIQTATVKTEGSSFLSKLSKYLAVLIIFFSATQFGLHFWPSSTLVYGIRIDYLSPTLYFLDLLILSYLVARRSVLKRNSWLQAKKGSAAAERTDLVGTLAPLLLTNLLYSQNPLATLSWSLHFLIYLSFVLSLRTVLKRNSWLQAKKGSAAAERTVLIGTHAFENWTCLLRQGIYDLGFILTLSLLFQATLAAAQVYLGHSVGGIMYYLGERMVFVGSPGIALGSFMDQVVLRAYGTFSHPNVLAGYAVISLLIMLRLSHKGSTHWMPTILTALLVILTQSRSAAISLFGIIIPFFLIKKLKYRLLYFVIIFSLLTSPFSLLHPTRTELSSLQRITLQNLSFSVTRSFPVFGAGAQSSISTYPRVDSSVRLLQPDHNSFTLFLSWFGIFGLIAILYSLRPMTHNLLSLLPILPLLLFDHYLLTSPQGLFILLLYLSTTSPVLNYIHVQKNREQHFRSASSQIFWRWSHSPYYLLHYPPGRTRALW